MENNVRDPEYLCKEAEAVERHLVYVLYNVKGKPFRCEIKQTNWRNGRVMLEILTPDGKEIEAVQGQKTMLEAHITMVALLTRSLLMDGLLCHTDAEILRTGSMLETFGLLVDHEYPAAGKILNAAGKTMGSLPGFKRSFKTSVRTQGYAEGIERAVGLMIQYGIL